MLTIVTITDLPFPIDPHLNATNFDSSAFTDFVLHFDVFPSGIFQSFTLDWMHLHESKGPTCRIATEMPRVDNYRAFQYCSSKRGKFRWEYQQVWLARHLPLMHILQIKIGRLGRREEWIVASLLQHVLRYASKASTWF